MAEPLSAPLNTESEQSITFDVAGDEYLLTTFAENDVAPLQVILSQNSVNRNLIAVPVPFTLSDAEFWVSTTIASQTHLRPLSTIQTRKQALFSQSRAVPLQCVRTKTGTFIGCTTLTPRPSEPVVELGYYLSPPYQGKRIIPAAAKVLLRYAANEWGVRRVCSSADMTNLKSQRILEGLASEGKDEERGEEIKNWPLGKREDGKGGEAMCYTWRWSIEPDKAYAQLS